MISGYFLFYYQDTRLLTIGYDYPQNPVIFEDMFAYEANCAYDRYGPSGTITPKMITCQLPTNKRLMAIMIISWYVYLFLTMFDICNVVMAIVPVMFDGLNYLFSSAPWRFGLEKR